MTGRSSRHERPPDKGGHRCFAACYDLVSRFENRGIIGRLRAELLAPLGGRVLDLGAGTGLNFPYYPPTAAIIAVEPDVFMLRRARPGAEAAGAALVRARGERLPFAGATFDHVVGTLVLCTIEQPEAALAEIARVLRPGGTYRFIEHVRGEGLAGRAQDIVRPVWKRLAGGCIVNRRTESLIRAAGFAVEQRGDASVQFGIPLVYGVAIR